MKIDYGHTFNQRVRQLEADILERDQKIERLEQIFEAANDLWRYGDYYCLTHGRIRKWSKQKCEQWDDYKRLREDA